MQHYFLITKKISSRELKALHRHYLIHSYNLSVLLVGHEHVHSNKTAMLHLSPCSRGQRGKGSLHPCQLSQKLPTAFQ